MTAKEERVSRYHFEVGRTYKRSEIKEAVGLDPRERGGSWDTGYVQYDGVDFVFCNVGSAGRTGHDYDNFFDGGDLVWRGKTNSHKDQPSIRRMTSPGAEVHIFWRDDDRQPFTYAGAGAAVEVSNETPVRVRWRFEDTSVVYPDDVVVPAGRTFVEGATRSVQVNAYERNAQARRECVRHHGASCHACGFDFGKTYGSLGHGFIHVHHKIPLAGIGKSYTLDPISDLVPVCPNCHAMLHRSNPPMRIDELRKLMNGSGCKR